MNTLGHGGDLDEGRLKPILRQAARFNQRGADHLVYWHNGGTGGYVSFLGMDKQHQVGIVLLSNYGDASVGNYDLDTIGYTLLEELIQSSG